MSLLKRLWRSHPFDWLFPEQYLRDDGSRERREDFCWRHYCLGHSYRVFPYRVECECGESVHAEGWRPATYRLIEVLGLLPFFERLTERLVRLVDAVAAFRSHSEKPRSDK